jgi:DNA replication protein DnaC
MDQNSKPSNATRLSDRPEFKELQEEASKRSTGTSSKVLSLEEFYRQTEALSRSAAQSLARQNIEASQRRAAGLLHRAAIPARFRGADLNLEAPGQAAAYGFVRQYADGFGEALRSGAGFLLYGPVGTGKTHLACALANRLLSEMRPVVYCTAMEAIMAVRATFNRREESEFDAYERFALPELLILDEVGVQRGTPDEVMTLTQIADRRSRDCLPTAIISNLDPGEILLLLGERAFDRLMGFGGQIVHMPGQSLRVIRGGVA